MQCYDISPGVHVDVLYIDICDVCIYQINLGRDANKLTQPNFIIMLGQQKVYIRSVSAPSSDYPRP